MAHNSGGPKADIVVPYDNKDTGYLASTKEEYAEKILEIIRRFHDSNELRDVQERARKSSSRFSEEQFAIDAQKCLSKLFV